MESTTRLLASIWEQRLNRRECGTDGLLLTSHNRRTASSVRGYSRYVKTSRDLAHHCDGDRIDLRSDEHFFESIVAAGSYTLRGYHPWYPLLVQVYFIYFGLPVFLDMRIPAMTAGIIAISLNAGAYISEIFRAGINSISNGQHEAARSLGLTRFQTMRLVVLPQATRRMIPTFVNQFIITIKDTSLLSAIGIAELTQSGEIIISSNFRAFEIWGVVGIFYLIIIVLLSRASRFIERRYAIR